MQTTYPPWQVVQQRPSLGQQGQAWYRDQQQPLPCQLLEPQALLLLELLLVLQFWPWPLLPSAVLASVGPGTTVDLRHTNTETTVDLGHTSTETTVDLGHINIETTVDLGHTNTETTVDL